MKPHAAPVRVPVAIASTRRMGGGRSRRTRTANVAPIAPMMNWPSTPILNTPLRKAMATARPVKISGVAATRVSLNGRTAAAMTFGSLVPKAAMIRAGSPKAPMSKA